MGWCMLSAIWFSGMESMALMLIVRDTGFTPGYMAAPSMSRVVAMLADLPGGGRLGGGKSGRARWPSGNSTLGDVSFWSSEAPLLRDCGLPEADSPEGGAVPFAAAAAAAASTHSTPQTEMRTGSNTSGNSPTAPQEGGQSNDVEMISDMMCSLVTNSCGETRFIGASVKTQMAKCGMLIVGPRVLLRVLDLLSEGHPVGE